MRYLYHWIIWKYSSLLLKRELNKFRKFLVSQGDTTKYTDEGLLYSIKCFVEKKQCCDQHEPCSDQSYPHKCVHTAYELNKVCSKKPN